MSSEQKELSLGMVYGESITEIPDNLYIPPDALKVLLDAFEGPLDLLLYLIRRKNIDILDIDVLSISEQYIRYIDSWQSMQFELASEYLVMATLLAEIKSRMLLPAPKSELEEEEDPRALLIQRLLEYERYKEAAEAIDKLPRERRNTYKISIDPTGIPIKPVPITVELDALIQAFKGVLLNLELGEKLHIFRERLPIRERMSIILEQLQHQSFVPFTSLHGLDEGKRELVNIFLALMNLVNESLVLVVQNEHYGPIHIKAI